MKPCNVRLALAGLALSAAAMGVPAQTAPSPVPQASAASAAAPDVAPQWLHDPVVAQHDGYTSTFIELPLPDGGGTPKATISGTSYTRPSANGQPRPVLFLFNGGPGASSTPLHLNAIGPKRFIERAGREPVRQLEPNTFTVLDQMDLVFIDPVGTGYSQVFEPGKSSYWGTEADAKAAATYIRHWLKAMGHEQSAVYVGGQSYGGFRLASMMKFASDLPQLRGLVFISPMLDATLMADGPGNELVYAMQLPTMVVAAWQHGKGSRQVQGKTVEQVFEQARTFSRAVYLPALLEGSRLSAKRSDQLAAQLSSLLGMSKAELLKQRLRPDSETFLTSILGQEGKRLGRLDTRVIGSSLPPPPGKPTNDPSLVVSASTGPALTPTEAYFVNELKVPVTRKYVPLSFKVNGSWNFFDLPLQDAMYLNATRYVGTAMRANPQLRLLYVGGYFDLATPIAAAEYALEHADLPMDRVRYQVLPGSHSPYDDDANLQRFTRVLRDFVQ